MNKESLKTLARVIAFFACISILLLPQFVDFDHYDFKRQGVIFSKPVMESGIYDVHFHLVVMEPQTFKEFVKKYFKDEYPESDFTILGMTDWSEDPPKVYMPSKNGENFDLDTLGHEIYYHVIKKERHERINK